jgi:Tol biopolymer transport system component
MKRIQLVTLATIAAWSRDGQRIALVSGPDDTTRIYAMNPDGTSPTPIVASAGWNCSPDW